MLEKINTPGFEFISQPSKEAISVLTSVRAQTADPTIAEIGVGIGATTCELLKTLENAGTLFLFDYADRVEELTHDLQQMPDANGVTIVPKGNGRERNNDYAWTLAMMMLKAQAAGTDVEIFDFVYLDGAHAFHVDAPACALLKEMIRPGGYIIFDDMYWSFGLAPDMNPDAFPEIRDMYSHEQIRKPHVEVVVKLMMETDARFVQRRFTDEKLPYRPVFQKIDAGPTVG